jgi:hypothetical protein
MLGDWPVGQSDSGGVRRRCDIRGMERNQRDWLVALTGVGTIVIAIIASVISGEPPSTDDNSAREIVEYYVDNKDSVEISAALSVAALTLFVFFGAYLRKVLDAAGGADSPLPLIAFTGTVVFGVGIAIDNTLLFAMAEGADDVNPTAVQALQAFWDNDFLPILFGLVLLLIGAGLSVIRFGGLPKWLGWVAVVLALAGATPVGFAAFIGGAL